MKKQFCLLLSMLLVLAGCGSVDWFPNAQKPQSFNFASQNDVEFNTQVTSETVTITGNTAPADIKILSGEYAIDAKDGGGTFTSAAGKISAGQTVTVRHTSAGTFSTATRTVITIGDVTTIFTSTTKPLIDPQPFSFAPQNDVDLHATVTSETITITGNAPISIVNGEYSIGAGAFTSAPGTISSGQTVAVRHTSASTSNTATSTDLTIGNQKATFTSTTKLTDSTGTLTLTASDFTEFSRDDVSVTELVIIELQNTSPDTAFTATATFVALDAGNNVLFTGTAQGIPDPADPTLVQMSATAVIDLATYAKITKWQVVSITKAP